LCAIPNEAGKPVREDGKPLPFRHGVHVTRLLSAEYAVGPEIQKGRKDDTLPLIALSLLVLDDP
jgi:hypothetical protein